MSTPSHLTTLTQYAKGLFQDTSNDLANTLSPVVVTGAADFYINDYAKRSAFQTPNAKRAIGGDSTAVLTDGERVRIMLDPYGLHDIIDNHELNQASNDPVALNLMRQARVRNILSQAGNSRLKETLTLARAGVGATASVWSASADPVALIDAQMLAIAEKIGMLPNKVVFSLGAWNIFRNSTKVIDRHPGSNQISAQAGNVGGMFLNPSSEVTVATSIFDTPMKATSAKAAALANEVYVYYGNDNADQYDGSFMKTFRIGDNPIQGVRSVQKDHGEKIIVDWTEAAYVNNSDAASRLTVTTS